MARRLAAHELAAHRLTLALAAALLAATGALHAQQAAAVAPRDDARAVAHVLERLTFGARPGDVARVQQMGLRAYIDQQLHPARIAGDALAARLRELPTIAMPTDDLWIEYFQPAQEQRRAQAQATARQDRGESPAEPQMSAATARRLQQAPLTELTQAKLLRAAFSERQLEEVLVDFWFNHFNVFSGKGQVRQYLTEYERDAIRPHVLGRFRDMLGATAQSPAMLIYLDNVQSRTAAPPRRPAARVRIAAPGLSPRARQALLAEIQQEQQLRQRGGGLNENYARELLELHTLGVDGGYTQDDVIEVARILSGWTIDRPQQGGRFVFRPAMHEPGTKTVLGQRFRDDGQREGERLLDLLAQHPSTARHIAFKLAQRFVADDPPQTLVDRVARTFLDTKGDLRAVTRAVIMSTEFFDEAYRSAKVKTPLEFVVSAVRATGAEVRDVQPMVRALQTLGMPIYGAQPPTGYSMTADAWVSTGALLARMNFAVEVAGGSEAARRQQGPRRQGRGGGAGADGASGRQAARAPIAVDVRALVPDTSAETIDRLVETVLAGEASEATRQTVARAETPQQALALVLGSPEFQKR